MVRYYVVLCVLVSVSSSYVVLKKNIVMFVNTLHAGYLISPCDMYSGRVSVGGCVVRCMFLLITVSVRGFSLSFAGDACGIAVVVVVVFVAVPAAVVRFLVVRA